MYTTCTLEIRTFPQDCSVIWYTPSSQSWHRGPSGPLPFSIFPHFWRPVIFECKTLEHSSYIYALSVCHRWWKINTRSVLLILSLGQGLKNGSSQGLRSGERRYPTLNGYISKTIKDIYKILSVLSLFYKVL